MCSPPSAPFSPPAWSGGLALRAASRSPHRWTGSRPRRSPPLSRALSRRVPFGARWRAPKRGPLGDRNYVHRAHIATWEGRPNPSQESIAASRARGTAADATALAVEPGSNQTDHGLWLERLTRLDPQCPDLRHAAGAHRSRPLVGSPEPGALGGDAPRGARVLAVHSASCPRTSARVSLYPLARVSKPSASRHARDAHPRKRGGK